MEQYIINNNVSDITYMSELTPHPEIHSLIFCWLGEGLIRRRLRLRLMSFHSVSRLLI